jgi:regulator of sigma E protease
METILAVIGGLVILVLLVVVHELGHAIVALRNGVVVKEFGIGFPPAFFKRKLKNGILFTLNWIPLGGFVRLKGEHDSANKKGDYGAASYWSKTKILFAGVVMNWVVAIVLLTILALTGMPKVLSNQFHLPNDTRTVVGSQAQAVVADITKDSAAAEAGFKKGDIITKLGPQKLESQDAIGNYVEANMGNEIQATIVRDGATKQLSIHLPTQPGSDGSVLGISSQYYPEKATMYATWSAPIVGIGTTLQLTGETFAGIGKLFVSIWQSFAANFTSDPVAQREGKQAMTYVTNSVSGPVGIVGSLFPQLSQAGLTAIVFFAALISLSLAVMNTLPIPALDGGRWFVMTLFRVMKKELTKEREENIQAVSVMVLIGLFILITIADIGKIVG